PIAANQGRPGVHERRWPRASGFVAAAAQQHPPRPRLGVAGADARRSSTHDHPHPQASSAVDQEGPRPSVTELEALHDGLAPRVAVVSVTYNSAAVLAACLRSLPSTGVDLKTVVVADNGSKDDSLGIAKSMVDLPILTVEMGRNAGYAAAIN